MKWFSRAVKKCTKFSGRASRKEFWLFALALILGWLAMAGVARLVVAKTGHMEIGLALVVLYELVALVPIFAFAVRRLHDLNRSAWWLLMSLVPFAVGVILVISFHKIAKNGELVRVIAVPLGAIILGFLPALKGDQNDNRYGAPLTVVKPDVTPPQSFLGKNRWVIVSGALVLCAAGGVLVYLRQNSRNPKEASGLAPLGPIVQVPPAVVFRGATRPLDGPSGNPSQVDIAAAEQDVIRHPRDPKTLNDLGCLLEASGDMARGHALLSQADRLKPDDPDIGYNYARSLLQQGKVDEAGKAADRLVTQNPDSAEARLLKASVAVQNRDYSTAQDQVAKVLKNSPEISAQGARPNNVTQLLKAVQIAALVIQGVVDLAKGKKQQGLASFQAALKLGSDPAALYNTGVAYQQLGQPAQAASYYQRAIAAQPTLAEAHHNLGGLMLAQNDLSGAQTELNTAASLKPDLLPSIQAAFSANKPDSQTAGLIAWTEMMRSIQMAMARLSGTKKMTLQEAIKSGGVQAVAHLTYNNVRLQLRKTAKAGSGLLELSVPPGSILVSSSNLYSDVLISKVLGRETVGQRIIPGPVSLNDSEPVNYICDGYLATVKQPAPQTMDFSVAAYEPNPLVACLAVQSRSPGSQDVQIALLEQTAGLTETQWKQVRQAASSVAEADWGRAESLVTKCKDQVR